jgi:hypothetical protein
MILTNNPKILSSYPASLWIDGGPLEVIMEGRRMVHEGYPLLAHPLMGDLHLIRNPYRTVILGEKREEIDLISLSWIEESFERIRLFYREHRNLQDSKDYQDIDFDLFQRVRDPKSVH